MKKDYISYFRSKTLSKGKVKRRSSVVKGLLATSMLTLLGFSANAQSNIANYTFAKSTGNAYIPITGGTVAFTGSYDTGTSAAITLPTAFQYGGVAITSLYINANGAIHFGSSSTGTTPLSSSGGTGAIAAFGQDGAGSTATGASPEIRYEDLGTEFVVQYQDHANYYNRSSEKLNFQIRLTYATGKIELVYGNCTGPGSSTTGTTVQVGIRGNNTTWASNVNNLMIGNIPAGTSCDWSKAVAGAGNASTMLFGSANTNVVIPNGLKFTWMPGTQLPVRTFVAPSNITGTSATLGWTAPTDAVSYAVQYRVNGECDWTDFGTPVTTNSVVLTGLNQSTNYQVRVKAIGASNESIYSHIAGTTASTNGYVAAGTFTTLLNCSSTPGTTSSSNVTSNSASIAWLAATVAPANGYEYYYSTTNTAPTNATAPSGSVGAGVLTAGLSSLSPATTYYYWVRTNCNGVDKGAWSASKSFTTLCASFVPPYTNNFSTVPGACWTIVSGGTALSPGTGTTLYWSSDTFLNAGNTSVSFNIYSTGRQGHIVSPVFDMSAGGYRLKFKYGFTMYNVATAVTAMGSDDEVQLVMSTDGGTTWSSLNTWDSSISGPLPNTATEYLVNLPSVTSNNVRFALFATSGTVNNNLDYEFHVDDFVIEAIPACIEPTAVLVSSTSSNGATINWTAASTAPADGYVVYYSTSNVAPTSATVLDATNSVVSTSTTATLNGLTASTLYYVWVKSVCSATSSSVWVAGSSFTTPCAAVNIPYSENFNGVTAPAIPNCTKVENLGSGNSWITYASAGGGFTGNVLNYSYASSSPANTWFYTVGLNLTAGTNYRITYKYGNASSTSYPEKLKVAFGTSALASAMINSIADHSNVVNGTVPITAVYDFTVPTSGVYYVGFNAYSASNMNRLYVDDITVDLSPTCFPPTGVTASAATSNSIDVSWTAPTVGVPQSYDIYYNTTNTAPTSATVPQISGVTGTTYTITGLNPSTFYYVWVKTSCSTTDQSEWSSLGSAITLCQQGIITSVVPATVCPNNTATLEVVGNADVFTWYDAATSGNTLGTGISFTTPVLAATTDYWVSASNVSLISGGKISQTGVGTNTGYSDVGLMFNANEAFKLKSVDVYPRGSVGSVVNAKVEVKNNAGVVVQTKNIDITVPAQTTPLIAVPLTLDFDIPVGTGYRLVFSGITPTTGLTGMVREDVTANFTYPYALGSAASITSAFTSSASSLYYYYFYNWQIETTCESPRQMVTATVSSAGCLGTNEVSVKSNVKVYPNPFKDVVNISGYENYVSGVVVDASGKVVKVLNKVEGTINLSTLSSGMYILTLTNKSGEKSSVKIIKN